VDIERSSESGVQNLKHVQSNTTHSFIIWSTYLLLRQNILCNKIEKVIILSYFVPVSKEPQLESDLLGLQGTPLNEEKGQLEATG